MIRRNLFEVEYVRVIAIVLIVLWHTFICPYLCWQLVDFGSYPTCTLFSILAIVFFPGDVMPLFTFISGYLFWFLIEQGKYGQFKAFAINKANRLIIPFFILGTLVNLTSYDRYPIDILWGEGSHLWYCCMLFWCFIITWLLLQLNKVYYLYTALLISLFLQFVYRSNWNMDCRLPLGIHNSLFFLGYFIFGFLTHKYVRIVEFVRKFILPFALFYFVICVLLVRPIIVDISGILTIIHNYYYSVILIAFFYKRQIPEDRRGNIIRSISKCSFGIYVFHEWISWNFCHVPMVTEFLKEHYLLFPILNFTWIFLLSYALTLLFLKTKAGRYLLL